MEVRLDHNGRSLHDETDFSKNNNYTMYNLKLALAIHLALIITKVKALSLKSL